MRRRFWHAILNLRELRPWLPRLAFAGLGLAAGGGYGLTRVTGASPFWPLLCVPVGLLIAAAGAYAAVRGRSWPAMGVRYERPQRVPLSPAEDQVQRIGPSPSDVAMWDALDRGEDPSR